MRIIKFRAWHLIQKRMYSPEEMGQDQLTLMPDGRGFVNVHSVSTSKIDNYEKMIPLQFTGILDKNGKEIYEGDIIAWTSGRYDNDPVLAPVGFEDGSFWMLDAINQSFGSVCNDWLRGEYEVLGNVYENPDLAKGEVGGITKGGLK